MNAKEGKRRRWSFVWNANNKRSDVLEESTFIENNLGDQETNGRIEREQKNWSGEAKRLEIASGTTVPWQQMVEGQKLLSVYESARKSSAVQAVQRQRSALTRPREPMV